MQTLQIQYQRKREMETEVKMVRNEIAGLSSSEHIEEKLKGMGRVLRRLKMIEKNVITMKVNSIFDWLLIYRGIYPYSLLILLTVSSYFRARSLCELSCGDALVLTELLFSSVLNGISSADHTNALLSCFVFEEPAKSSDKKGHQVADKENSQTYKKLKQRVMDICKIQEASKLEVKAKKYVESFSSVLMDMTRYLPCL